ncbi:MAG: lipopolysaccharide assembly protein LapB [Wenzhouxiangellaceae bacterium]
MPEALWLVTLLLPVAAWSGWWMAGRQHARGERRHRNTISSNYFRGLNYLLNEQPDKAIEVFLKLAEINTETVETHLALGNLFRRRGEMDKAIRFHRHIMTRSTLSEEHRTRALLELGEDYMRAGLLDRAEKLFSELIDDPRHANLAIENLLNIYQQEKDWAQAIEQAERLSSSTGRDPSVQIAHFHCELAVEAIARGQNETAAAGLQAARRKQPDSVRARLIEAQLHLSAERWAEAEALLREACEIDPDIIVIMIDDLVECFCRQDRQQDLIDWLHTLIEQTSTLAPALALATVMARSDPNSAIGFLLERLQRRPTARGLYHVLELMHEHGHRIEHIDPELLRRLMHRLLSEQPRFRCQRCGFSGQTLNWQCPSCREWETTRPVIGVLGE